MMIATLKKLGIDLKKKNGIPTVYMIKGLPASGKSTLAREMIQKHLGRFIRVNRDDIRRMIGNGYTEEIEEMVKAVKHASIRSALDSGYDVISDDTNLKPEDYIEVEAIAAHGFHSDIEIVIIDLTKVISVEDCIQRDRNRGGPMLADRVGKNVIMDMYNKYVKN